MWELKNIFVALLLAIFIFMAGSGIGSAAEIIVHNGESIQAAVDSAPNGSVIILEPGTYSGNVTVLANDLTFMSSTGNPDDVIIQDVAMSGASSANASISFRFGGGSIDFKNITFKGDEDDPEVAISSLYPSTGTIENCKIIDYSTGVDIDRQSTYYFINNTFINCESAIAVWEFSSIYGHDNTFIDCGETVSSNEEFYPLAIELENSTIIKIVHNGESIQAAVDSAPNGSVIILEPGTYSGNVTVLANDLTFMSSTGNPDDVIIQDVAMLGASSADASISFRFGGGSIDFKYITFKGDEDDPEVAISSLYPSTGTIENCKIIDYSTGVDIDRQSTYYFINNTFINCGSAIAVWEFSSIYGHDNTFIDCGETVSSNEEFYPLAIELTDSTIINTTSEQPTVPSDNKTETNTTIINNSTTETNTTIINNSTTETNTTIINNNTTETNTTETENNTTEEADTTETNSTKETDSNGSSSRHSSSHSSSSGGGAGGSPEPAKNVASKEISQVFITNGKPVVFNFPKKATCVEYIQFEAKKTAGKTTTIVEDLKDKSTLVSDLPEGEVYKSFNVWVGNSGYGDSDNILNASICFKVNNSWIQENDINKSSIFLYKYDSEDENEEWTEFPATLTDEDDDYLYFSSNVSGYYSFVITGENKISTVDRKPAATFKGSVVNDSENADVTEKPVEDSKAPGFGIISGVVCLFCMFLYRIKGR